MEQWHLGDPLLFARSERQKTTQVPAFHAVCGTDERVWCGPDLGHKDFANWAVRWQAKVKAEPLLQRLAPWRSYATFQVRMKLWTVYLCSNIYLETWYLSGPLCDQVVVRRSQMLVMAETQGPAGGHQKQGRSTAKLDRGYCQVTKENSLRNLWTLPTQWRQGWKNSGKTYYSHWSSSSRFLVVARRSVVPVMAATQKLTGGHQKWVRSAADLDRGCAMW